MGTAELATNSNSYILTAHVKAKRSPRGVSTIRVKGANQQCTPVLSSVLIPNKSTPHLPVWFEHAEHAEPPCSRLLAGPTFRPCCCCW